MDSGAGISGRVGLRLTSPLPEVITSGLPPTLTHRVWFPLVMKGYGPDSPPMGACVAPFAVISTSAGFRAAYDANGNMTLRVEVSGTQRITYTQEFNAENRLSVVTNTVTGQVTRFVYDGDGNRVLRIDGSGTTVTLGDYYERQGAAVTKYYYAGGQRIAMRAGGVVYYLHGDHLGSATLTTDINGNRVGELRYLPYGETRYVWGVTPTNRRYTGQSWEDFGLYDYGARYYSVSLGRFVSADVVVAAPGKPQSLNRYAYVYNSPLRYTDPSGLIAQQEAGQAQEIISLLQRDYRLFVHVDFGWRFLPVMHPAPGEPTAHVIWEEGMWQLAELELLFEAVRDLASVMGGAEHFRENLGGVWVERAVMRYAGLGAAHRIVLNAGGFTKWTVVHELAHAWDAVRGWRLSRDMQEAMGAGFAHPIRHFFAPNNRAYWYDPGQGPPPCGVDANFNRKEDFAEAVTAYVYPEVASEQASRRGWPYTDPGRGYAYVSFLETPRGQFIHALLTDHSGR